MHRAHAQGTCTGHRHRAQGTGHRHKDRRRHRAHAQGTGTGHRTQDTGTRIGAGTGTGHRTQAHAQDTGHMHRAQTQSQTQAQCTDTGADTGKGTGTGTMKISVFCWRRHAKAFPGSNALRLTRGNIFVHHWVKPKLYQRERFPLVRFSHNRISVLVLGSHM